MRDAYAKINALVREGELRYEVLFQETYRHNFWRLGWFATEALAIQAASTRAGGPITIQAGTYPRGTRKPGDLIEVW